MNEALKNPSAVAQKLRREAIERINKPIQAARDSSSQTGNQDSGPEATAKSGASDGSPGYIAADGTYVPNRVALKTRVANSLLSLGMVVYGLWGVYRDDLIVPISKRTTSHFHSISAWIMYAAILCGSVHLMAVVIDHYDRRNNEHLYQRLGELSGKIGWLLFGIAFIVGLTHHQISLR